MFSWSQSLLLVFVLYFSMDVINCKDIKQATSRAQAVELLAKSNNSSDQIAPTNISLKNVSDHILKVTNVSDHDLNVTNVGDDDLNGTNVIDHNVSMKSNRDHQSAEIVSDNRSIGKVNDNVLNVINASGIHNVTADSSPASESETNMATSRGEWTSVDPTANNSGSVITTANLESERANMSGPTLFVPEAVTEISLVEHAPSSSGDNVTMETKDYPLDMTVNSNPAMHGSAASAKNAVMDDVLRVGGDVQNGGAPGTSSNLSAPQSGSEGFLQGERGDQGGKGDLGVPGVPGAQGTKGDRGFNGTDGLPGQKGERGLIGFPGYQGEEGYQSPHQQCVQCPPGPQGPLGHKGHPGDMGPQGLAGLDGLPGEPGLNGTRGRRGKKGKEGLDGEPGLNGLSGAKGDKGDKGELGTADIEAITKNCTCQKGDRGELGVKGKRGLIGFIGYKGEPGDPGPVGPPGPLMEGLPGPPGSIGLQGPKGQKGEQGRPFVTGSNLLLETPPPTTTLAPTTTMPTTTVEPTVDPRLNNCRIRMVGKPLFKRYTGTYWGSFMKDPEPLDRPSGDKYWFTRHFTGKLLYEYANDYQFRQEKFQQHYELTELYFGTGHLVYRNAFFYHRAGYNEIVRYDLVKKNITARLTLPKAAYHGKDYVYSTEYNYFDMAADENGLWVIYGDSKIKDLLLVSKVTPDELTVEKTWEVTVDHRNYGNGFITCGVLYLIKDTHTKQTVIDFVYDLYTKSTLPVRLAFTNPFQMNNMIAFNHRDKQVYSWDKGNQLTYPLLL